MRFTSFLGSTQPIGLFLAPNACPLNFTCVGDGGTHSSEKERKGVRGGEIEEFYDRRLTKKARRVARTLSYLTRERQWEGMIKDKTCDLRGKRVREILFFPRPRPRSEWDFFHSPRSSCPGDSTPHNLRQSIIQDGTRGARQDRPRNEHSPRFWLELSINEFLAISINNPSNPLRRSPNTLPSTSRSLNSFDLRMANVYATLGRKCLRTRIYPPFPCFTLLQPRPC